MEVENPAAVCECTERHDKAERRNLMLITSAVLQWMLMIVFIVYLAVLYHQSHQEPTLTKQFVRTDMQSDASENNTEVILERKDGNMAVRNGCIEIFLDGYYLLNAQGLTRDNKTTGGILFHFKHKSALGSDNRDKFTQPVLQGTVGVTLIKKLYRDTKVCITKNVVMEQFDLVMYLV
ncbi:uncharacterized protein LOC143927029 [Lithobates pipiens]